MMAAAREEGMDVLADTTPFRRGPRPALRDPAAVGRGRRARGGARARCEIPTTRRRLRTECDRYWRFIHKGEWDRVRLQASEQHPDWDGLSFARDRRRCAKTDPWDCFFDVLADAGDAYESILVVGTLFTDEHLAEMISHPLFCLGVDTFTVTLEGRSPTCSAIRSAMRGTSTTSRTTCGRTARCASRRRSGR